MNERGYISKCLRYIACSEYMSGMNVNNLLGVCNEQPIRGDIFEWLNMQ